MMIRTLLMAGSLLALLAGCAMKKQDLSAFYSHPPRSIVVVPVVNESTEVTAPTVFMTTITTPLAEHGYYVFPVYLTGLLFQDIGLPEAGLIHQLPPQRFFELFGADAVLFITIKDWSTNSTQASKARILNGSPERMTSISSADNQHHTASGSRPLSRAVWPVRLASSESVSGYRLCFPPCGGGFAACSVFGSVELATATLATFATFSPLPPSSVATVAAVTVAIFPSPPFC